MKKVFLFACHFLTCVNKCIYMSDSEHMHTQKPVFHAHLRTYMSTYIHTIHVPTYAHTYACQGLTQLTAIWKKECFFRLPLARHLPQQQK